MINLEEQIKLLVELQGLDAHILRLRRELDAIPQEIKKMEDDFKEKADGLKRIEEGVKSLQLKRKEKEMDLESQEGTIKKYRTQLYQLKTNKEYTTMEQEIEKVKADSSVVEEDIIKILDQIDAQNQKAAKEKEYLKFEEGRLAEEKKKKSEETKKIEEELGALDKQREELTAKVDKSILPKYERILKNKDGLAVVPIAAEACQGCFRIMPPQVINEVKMKKDIVLCENCARILYIEE